MKLSRMTLPITLVALTMVVAVASAQRGQVATSRAVLTSIYGDVQVRHGASGYQAAKLNEVLAPSDAVKTGASSRAEISVGEGGYVRMDQNSQVLITALASGGTTSFQALAGGIWVTIERALSGSSKFEVRMPSAVASVTGTVFRCEVAEDGTSETYVYEGQVDVQAGEENFQVAPDECCEVPRNNRPGSVRKFDLAGDDEATWVMYNRHRDIIRHLGNPGIMVGLREHDMPEAGAFLASKAIGAQLALHGLSNTSIADVDASSFTINADGTIDWRRKPRADYSVIGDVTLEQVRQINGVFSARVRGNIRLVRNGDSDALTFIDAVVPGIGEDVHEAVHNALLVLGKRVGSGLAPRVIREMMQAKAGTVRIDISGGSRAQVSMLKQALAHADGIIRTEPLVLPGERISLAVITQLSPEQIGQLLQERAPGAVEVVASGGRVLYVRFAGEAGPTGQASVREPPTAPQRRPAVEQPQRPPRPRFFPRRAAGH